MKSQSSFTQTAGALLMLAIVCGTSLTFAHSIVSIL
jgi:hypothetical protein